MLELNEVVTCYGVAQALFGVSLKVGSGEVVALMGRNGMGKSTTIRSIMGLTPPSGGTIRFEGKPIHSMASYRIARLGIGLVPEGRQIFPTLTVRENLLATAANFAGNKEPYTLDRVFSIFPRLSEREHQYGGDISGGEQQMLAVARALMINPRLLLLDEATEGLAPIICREIWKGLAVLKERGLAILVVDKNVDQLLEISDRTYLMEKGLVVWEGDSDPGVLTDEVKQRYLGI